MIVVRVLALVCALSSMAMSACSPQRQPLNFEDFSIVDLSHAFGPETVYWPNADERFEMRALFEGEREDGFYAAFAFSMPEHGGTHIDAPYHFHKQGDTTEAIDLSRLIGPVVVIDATAAAAADASYRLTRDDVARFEELHGRIAPGSIVLMRTGWSKYWPDAETYLGGSSPDDLVFPSFGADAARMLIEDRRISALGVDTASTDYGSSKDFPVHRLIAEAGVPGFENLDQLHKLPATGALIIALPAKISSGSGGPLRAVALVPKP